MSRLQINNNSITGSNMTSLISTMKTFTAANSAHEFLIYNQDNAAEGNTITNEQLDNVRAKKWIPKKYHNGRWVEITGADDNLPGDIDGMGSVDGNDINILINILLGKDSAANYNGRANVDGQGGVDGNDLNALINIILGK
ncbi:MAG: hypothetical protein IKQ89_02160 [Muribaculaceae bacterium]|nr:hypothetical protein [Muribaculaceae bacterium]